MSSLALRILAVTSMLIDHLGFALHGILPEPITMGMRLAGRLAMPIYCFLIAEGFFYTRGVARYAGRLLLFGLISEIPYDICFSRGKIYVDWSHQNVFFTLLLGLFAIWLCDHFTKQGQSVLSLISVLACAALAQLAQTDYGMFGVMLIFVCYCFRPTPKARGLAIAIVCVLMGFVSYLIYSSVDMVWAITLASAAVSVIPISLYNGSKGKGGKKLQLAFYAFYPLHLTLIALLLMSLT